MKTFEMYVNNTRNAQIDFAVTAGRLETTLDSVVWAVEEGNSVVLGDAALSGNIAQTGLVSTSKTGCNLIRCVATLANNEIVSEYFKVQVTDPTCTGGNNERW